MAPLSSLTVQNEMRLRLSLLRKKGGILVGTSRRFSSSCIGCDLIASPTRAPIQGESVNWCKRLADEAAEVLGVKSRTEAVHTALREIVALKRFQKLMSKYGGKLEFSGHDE